MPVAEAQSKLVADCLRGKYALPPQQELLRRLERDRHAMFSRYVTSRRHTMQIDVDDYLYDLAQERLAGVARARLRAAVGLAQSPDLNDTSFCRVGGRAASRACTNVL